MFKSYKCVIIGGVSAGLAADIQLKKLNIDSLLIEKEEFLGGILNQCIHNGFGLTRFKEELTGPSYAERLVS
ncbi:MAG: pyridine nucleotide-disulfide oxidoreductase, partial [Ignavibacteria bacterium]|nr:pyridine nucleotide-disulfide oxidoreductase [Ignavibacteria bacterium]